VSLTTTLADYYRRQGDVVTLEWHAGGHEIRPNEIEAAKAFFSPYGA
jgi:phospholipase/carboxylesterase